jgi:hypothetical protein
MLTALAMMLTLAAQPGTQPTTAPLAGPAVPARLERPTLVHLDLTNRLRRPETTPEEAAIGLLSLDAEVRTRVEAILTARAAAIDRFVAGNLLLLGQLDTVSKGGSALDKALTTAEVYLRFRPILEEGPLADRIAAVLPTEPAARFRTLLAEYWRAAVADGMAQARAAGKRDPAWAVHLGERLRHVGEEVARSFQRQSESGTLFLDYLVAGLGLSPEQERTLTELKLDFLERTGFKPTEKQQQVFIAGALGYLTQAQRTAALHKIAAVKR